MAEEKKPLFKKSVGPSQYDWSTNEFESSSLYDDGKDGDGEFICYKATCEICGEDNYSENPISLSKFLGRQVVDFCCGEVLDIVFKENGEQMAIRFLEEFAKNPTDDRFKELPKIISESLAEAKKKILKTSQKTVVAAKQLDSFNKAVELVEK